jgi:hypothetical protein
LFNFIEASLEAYHALKRTGATVTVAIAHTESLEEQTASTESVLESPITWRYELLEQLFEQVRGTL